GAGFAPAPDIKADPRRSSPQRYDMKKSINLWAFPYPQRMTLNESLQLAMDAGFDGIELNYDLENDLSLQAGTKEFDAIGKKLDVFLNIENIFFNGYLMTPQEMNAFVDGFKSKHVRVHFDTGNIMLFQFPEHWISQLGSRIKNVHLKEFTKKGTDHSLESFRTLLDGTTNWPAVLEAFDKIGYRGYLTFEYFHPFAHYPEALIYQTSDALDRILGKKWG